jgi:hypothetical protein
MCGKAKADKGLARERTLRPEPHLARSSKKPCKNNHPTEPQCAAFYLAFRQPRTDSMIRRHRGYPDRPPAFDIPKKLASTIIIEIATAPVEIAAIVSTPAISTAPGGLYEVPFRVADEKDDEAANKLIPKNSRTRTGRLKAAVCLGHFRTRPNAKLPHNPIVK